MSVWNNVYQVSKKMQNEAATCIHASRPPLDGGGGGGGGNSTDAAGSSSRDGGSARVNEC